MLLPQEVPSTTTVPQKSAPLLFISMLKLSTLHPDSYIFSNLDHYVYTQHPISQLPFTQRVDTSSPYIFFLLCILWPSSLTPHLLLSLARTHSYNFLPLCCKREIGNHLLNHFFGEWWQYLRFLTPYVVTMPNCTPSISVDQGLPFWEFSCLHSRIAHQ